MRKRSKKKNTQIFIWNSLKNQFQISPHSCTHHALKSCILTWGQPLYSPTTPRLWISHSEIEILMTFKWTGPWKISLEQVESKKVCSKSAIRHCEFVTEALEELKLIYLIWILQAYQPRKSLTLSHKYKILHQKQLQMLIQHHIFQFFTNEKEMNGSNHVLILLIWIQIPASSR